MVVTLVLGTSALGRAGSSPAFGTSALLVKWTSRNATNVKLQFRLLQRVLNGGLAEWLGGGLQNLLQQFESVIHLNKRININNYILYIINVERVLFGL
jgi:hypothetical protein